MVEKELTKSYGCLKFNILKLRDKKNNILFKYWKAEKLHVIKVIFVLTFEKSNILNYPSDLSIFPYHPTPSTSEGHFYPTKAFSDSVLNGDCIYKIGQ